jgi:hypothetical protein
MVQLITDKITEIYCISNDLYKEFSNVTKNNMNLSST